MRAQDFVCVSTAVQDSRNDNQFSPTIGTDMALDYDAATVVSGRGLNVAKT